VVHTTQALWFIAPSTSGGRANQTNGGNTVETNHSKFFSGLTAVTLGLTASAGMLIGSAGSASAAPTPAPILTASAFDDVNENGIREANEAGVAGATVSVFRGTRLQAQATTGADGTVRFAKLVKGSVNIEVSWPEAFVPTSATELRSKVDAARPTAVTFGFVPRVERTVAISIGDISTIAGSGAAATVDGTPLDAGFSNLRGLALVHDQLFVESADTIRSIDTDTGIVSTLAGRAGSNGCGDGVGAAAQFNASGPMSTDGTSLYAADFCGASGQALRKVNIATGETTTMWSTTSGFDRISGIAVAPDGTLYTASTVGRTYFTTVIRRWTAAGPVDIASIGATTTTSYIAGSLAVDRNGAYVTVTSLGASVDYEVRRFDLTSFAWTKVATNTNVPTAMASAGRFLYVGSFGSIVRVEKATGASARIAGHQFDQTGFADGSGDEIRFNGVTAIVSDGQGIYVADTNNHRIRLITDLVALV
jgi:SdrD B-like domain